MEAVVIVSLVMLTSAAGFLVGRNLLGLSGPDLGRAIRQMLECCGVSFMFGLANLIIGVVVIVVFREITGTFVSLYFVNDIALILASVLQGIVFFCWYDLAIRGEAADRSPTRRSVRQESNGGC